MAEQSKTWLRDFLLGNQPTTKATTVANIIGGTLMGGSFLGALERQPHSYETYTKPVQLGVSAVRSAASTRSQEAEKRLTADLAGYEQAAVEQAQTGLGARGITDRRVGAESAQNIRAGLSGAYAKAKAALTKARFNAESGLANVVGQYQMNVAEKQMQSQLKRYADNLGLWGALTGAGAVLMQLPKSTTPKITADTGPQDYRQYIFDPMEVK